MAAPLAQPADEAADFIWNPRRGERATLPQASREPLEFHRRLPGYQPTRLVHLDALAAELGLERLWLKDESNRFELPAFKVLGVSWATYRALVERLGSEPTWESVEDLRDAFAPLRPLTLITATTGNHGRAVARVAALFGLTARVFVPAGAHLDRVAAIAGEGAEVVEASGGYDEAVEEAARWAEGQSDGGTLLISDTATTEVDRVAAWISAGYSSLFWEAEEQLAAAGEGMPDAVVVQIGVGSLAFSAATHFRREGLASAPALIGVETQASACLLESARAGGFQTVPGPHDSQMFCLNAGVPSRSGVAGILAAFEAFVAIGDGGIGAAVRALAQAGVVAGPTGAAGLIGLTQALPLLATLPCKRVLLINTEGAADPSGYARALR